MEGSSTQSPPTARKSFDLASRYAAETVDVVIYDPADPMARIDTGARVTIRSLYSKEAKDAAQAVHAALRLVDGKVDASSADFEQNLFEQTVAVVVGWTSGEDYPDTLLIDGAPTACTPDAVRLVFSDPRMAWVQKQVQSAYLDLGRFFSTPKAS